mgnify:CR=1 FL=1
MTNPYVAQMRQWRQTLTKDQRWAILIAADPDALASALALKRIMAHRVRGVDIFRINEVTRPDNLAMIRYLRIPAKLWQPEKADLYTNFAMVDSQPHHNPAFQGIPFDQYTKMTGMNEEQIIMDAKEPAANQVRMDLAIRAIIKAEGLEVSDEEVENEMKTVAEKYGMDLDTVKKYLRPEDVKEQVVREKVMKLVADNAVAVAPAEEKAELEAEGEIVEKKPAKKAAAKKAEGEKTEGEKAEKKPAAKKTAKKDAE